MRPLKRPVPTPWPGDSFAFARSTPSSISSFTLRCIAPRTGLPLTLKSSPLSVTVALTAGLRAISVIALRPRRQPLVRGRFPFALQHDQHVVQVPRVLHQRQEVPVAAGLLHHDDPSELAGQLSAASDVPADGADKFARSSLLRFGG